MATLLCLLIDILGARKLVVIVVVVVFLPKPLIGHYSEQVTFAYHSQPISVCPSLYYGHFFGLLSDRIPGCFATTI
jgi:hypothetical protein